MAGLTVGLAFAGASALAASLYTLNEAIEEEKEEIILQDGRKISTGAIVKLKDEALEKYAGKGLMKPGADHSGLVEIINQDPLSIEVSNQAQGRRFTDKYDPADFILITPAPKFGGEYLRIQGGFAREGVRVRMLKQQGSDNTGNGKALGNPFYNSVGIVKAVKPKEKLVSVVASQIKTPETKWIQDYNASELEFVSLPPLDLKPGFATSSGYINVGTRVSLSNDILEKAKKGQTPYKTFFLAASEDYESEGVVTKLRLDKQNRKVATVKCQKKGKDIVYEDQDYYAEFLRPLRADGIPHGGVPIFGGIASNGIKVKLRDEKKDSEPTKCLSRSTFGYTGVVEEVDPDATDGLKVLVRCTGSNEGEEASDWYDPDSLELVDLPTGEGVPIFGGVATIGSLVEVTVDARGVKCLGKPNIGNIGIVMGIDPNSPNGEVLNIRCGRDQRTNSKVTNWYKPTDVKKFVKMSEEGTEIDRIRAQLDIEQIKLRSAQSKKDAKAEGESKQKIAELEAKLKELEGEGQSREKNLEEYNRSKEELMKTRQLIASLEEQYQQASIETTCNPEGLNIESQIKQNARDILDGFCTDPIDFSIFYKHFEVEFSEGSLGEKDVTKKNADNAVEAYNKDPDNDDLKKEAKRLVDLYNESKKKMVSSLTTIQKNYIDKRHKFKLAIRAVQPKWETNPKEFVELINAECEYTNTIKDLANRDVTIKVVSDEGVPPSALNQIITNYVTARSEFEAYLKGTPDADIKTLYESYEAFKKAYEDVVNEVHGTSTVTEKNIQKLVKQSKDKGREVFEAEEEAEKALMSKAETLEDEQIIDFYRQYITIEKRNNANDLQNQIKKVAISGPTPGKGLPGTPGVPKPVKGVGPPAGAPPAGAPPSGAPPKTPKPGKSAPPGAPPAATTATTGTTSGGGFVGGAISFEKADAIEKYKEISLAYAKLCRNLKKLAIPPIPTPSSTTGAPGTGAPGTGAPATGAPGTGAPATGAPGTGAPGTGAPATGAPGTGAPATGAPGTGAPGTGAPATGAPGTGAPGTGAPATGAPGTGAPGTGAPATGGPILPPLAPPPVRSPVDLTALTRARRLHEARVASAFGAPADSAFGSRGRITSRNTGDRRLEGTSAALDPEDLVAARAAYADAAGPEFDEEGRITSRNTGDRRLEGTSAALSPPPPPSEFPVLPGSDAVPVLPENTPNMSLAQASALAQARQAALPPTSVPNPFLPPSLRRNNDPAFNPIGSNPSGRPGPRPFGRPGERAETDPVVSERIATRSIADAFADTSRTRVPEYYPQGSNPSGRPGYRSLGRPENAEALITIGPNRRNRLNVEEGVLTKHQSATPSDDVSRVLLGQRKLQGLQKEIDKFLDTQIFGKDGSLSRLQQTPRLKDIMKPEYRDRIRNAIEETVRMNYVRQEPPSSNSILTMLLPQKVKWEFLYDDLVKDDAIFKVNGKTKDQKTDSMVIGVLHELGLIPISGGRKTRRRKVKKSNRRRTIRR